MNAHRYELRDETQYANLTIYPKSEPAPDAILSTPIYGVTLTRKQAAQLFRVSRTIGRTEIKRIK